MELVIVLKSGCQVSGAAKFCAKVSKYVVSYQKYITEVPRFNEVIVIVMWGAGQKGSTRIGLLWFTNSGQGLSTPEKFTSSRILSPKKFGIYFLPSKFIFLLDPTASRRYLDRNIFKTSISSLSCKCNGIECSHELNSLTNTLQRSRSTRLVKLMLTIHSPYEQVQAARLLILVTKPTTFFLTLFSWYWN